MANSRIIVIGAGIGGLATAIALGRAGIDAEVYEQSAELAPVGAGLSLWNNALVALDRLGVGDAVRARSVAGTGAGLRTRRGDILVDSASTDLGDRFGEYVIVVHRGALQHALLDAVAPGVVRLGHACVGIDADESGVTARFANGHVARADALIGADGLHSIVRVHLHGEAPPRYSGYTAWRAVLRFDHRRLRVGESWGLGRRFGQMPMSDGQVYWFATATVAAGSRAADNERAELLRRFGGWHDPIEALIDATPDAAILRNDIYDRPPLKRWGRGRVTLLGDAAHPMTPNLGQGGCQAIEDAVLLARALQGSTSVEPALRAYEAQRIPRTSRFVLASRRVGAIGQIENPILAAARNFVVRTLGGRLQAKQIAQFIEPVV